MRPLRCILVAAARCGLGRVVLRLWVLAATEALGRWLATAGGALRARGVIARSVSGSETSVAHACEVGAGKLARARCRGGWWVLYGCNGRLARCTVRGRAGSTSMVVRTGGGPPAASSSRSQPAHCALTAKQRGAARSSGALLRPRAAGSALAGRAQQRSALAAARRARCRLSMRVARCGNQCRPRMRGGGRQAGARALQRRLVPGGGPVTGDGRDARRARGPGLRRWSCVPVEDRRLRPVLCSRPAHCTPCKRCGRAPRGGSGSPPAPSAGRARGARRIHRAPAASAARAPAR